MSEEAKLYPKVNWLVVYTKPRWEKKVANLLQRQGIENFCPLNRVVKQWSDRKKKVDVPLFTSYVFVRITEDQKDTVRRTDGVVNFVYWLGRPAVILDKEMQEVQDFVRRYKGIEIQAIDVFPGQEIEITSGAFRGLKGTVIKVSRNKVELILRQLQIKLLVNLPKDLINGQ